MIEFCSWCNSAREPGGKWETIEAVIPEKKIFKTCPICEYKLVKSEGIEKEYYEEKG